MEVVEVKLRDEYIKLGQALKAAHVVGSGVDDFVENNFQIDRLFQVVEGTVERRN